MITRSLKTHVLYTALLLGSLGAIPVGANAQSVTARATVPFEFAAGGASMPAGEYSVDVSNLSGVIILHGTSGHSVELFSSFAEAPASNGTAKLLFEKRDGMAYLAGVQFPDQSVRVSAPFQRVMKGAAIASLR